MENKGFTFPGLKFEFLIAQEKINTARIEQQQQRQMDDKVIFWGLG